LLAFRWCTYDNYCSMSNTRYSLQHPKLTFATSPNIKNMLENCCWRSIEKLEENLSATFVWCCLRHSNLLYKMQQPDNTTFETFIWNIWNTEIYVCNIQWKLNNHYTTAPRAWPTWGHITSIGVELGRRPTPEHGRAVARPPSTREGGDPARLARPPPQGAVARDEGNRSAGVAEERAALRHLTMRVGGTWPDAARPPLSCGE
jgi:hypothetical protein